MECAGSAGGGWLAEPTKLVREPRLKAICKKRFLNDFPKEMMEVWSVGNEWTEDEPF